LRALEARGARPPPFRGIADAAIPTLEAGARRLAQIPGAMPRLSAIPVGCAFAPRCRKVFERCAERPPLIAIGDRGAACWLCDRAAVAADART
jgi:peptide/nickel transport system ATP-binding protein